MSDGNSNGWLSRNWRTMAATTAAVATLGGGGYGLTQDVWPQIVPAQNFGARIRNGQLMSDELQPGIYWVRPVFDKVYHFPNNTQIVEGSTAGNKNSADQNDISTEYRIHFQVNPKVGYLALHAEEMDRDGGQKLVTKFVEQAVDTAAGRSRASDSLANPKAFMETVVANQILRMRQNNVPAEMVAFELLTMSSGKTRQPVQLRWSPEAGVTEMAPIGPGAVTVPHAVSPAAKP